LKGLKPNEPVDSCADHPPTSYRPVSDRGRYASVRQERRHHRRNFGGADTFLSKGKAKTIDAKLARMTAWVAFAFVVLTFVLNLV
jgi:hypothetical protein